METLDIILVVLYASNCVVALMNTHWHAVAGWVTAILMVVRLYT